MSDVFQRRYPAAEPFDASDPNDALADRARRAVLRAVQQDLENLNATNGEQMSYVAGGLLLGVTQVMASMVDDSDEAHASIRASIIQLAPWAVDMMRASIGRDPLGDDAPREEGKT